MLKTGEGARALEPFAFVSSLAGALLVLEMLRLGHFVCKHPVRPAAITA